MKLFKWHKPRFLFAALMIPIVFLIAETTVLQLYIGFILMSLGELVRFWADGYVGHVKVNRNKIGLLITAGPYAYTRNPLYLGSFLIGLGVMVIVGRWLIALPLSVAMVWIYYKKSLEEDEVILAEWKDMFQHYCQKIPRFFPTLRPYPNPQGQWSWKGISASKEWKTVVWVPIFFLALYFRREIIQEHVFFTPETWIKHTILLGVIAILIATDGILEFRKRQKYLQS